ncbi:hypothetical protein [Nocardioides sp.]|uniref:hypothetical protein n=1 Tax=Nocardioides sp. TaxID=35761 RepID=UPI002B271D7D|nr:hypothetical protein [Nocardioides sp.]
MRILGRPRAHHSPFLVVPALLAVTLAGAPVPAALSAPAAPSMASVPVTALLDAPDPGLPGPYDVVTSDYELEPVQLVGLELPVEQVGHVVEPAPDAPVTDRPLVVFMHGDGGQVCHNPSGGTPSYTWPCAEPSVDVPHHLGFEYLQQVLASQGYVTVSVRANGIVAQEWDGSDARAQLLRLVLDRWVDLAPEHQVDLDQVVLVGHAEGGEGVNRTSMRRSAADAYRIVGQVLIAPSSRGGQTASYVPTVVLQSYCGDTSYQAGNQGVIDRGRDVVDDDPSLKGAVMVMGANVNFYDTLLTPGLAVGYASDDWWGPADELCGKRTPARLRAAQQREVATAYVAGAVALFTGDDSYLPLFDGSPVTVDSVGDADVRSHALGGGRVLRRPGIEASPTTPSGGAEIDLCVGGATIPDAQHEICGASSRGSFINAPHWGSAPEGSRPFLAMQWATAGAAGGLQLDEPLDLRSERLQLRTIVDWQRGPVDLLVRLGDGTGATALVRPVNLTRAGHTLEPLPVSDRAGALWAQALIVHAADEGAGSEIDLADVVSVELVVESGQGGLWVAEVSTVPDALAPVPDLRLPRVGLGTVEVLEGDGPEGGTAQVPLILNGEITEPARIAVHASSGYFFQRRFVVDLPVGSTSGSIIVDVPPGDLLLGAEPVARQIDVRAWALENVAVDDYIGLVKILQDDVAPAFRVRTVRPKVVEGKPVRLRIRIPRTLPYAYDFSVHVVRGPGTDLTARDAPPKWLYKHAYGVRPSNRPLHEVGARILRTIHTGTTTHRATFPTRDDGVREGRERLTLQVRAYGRVVERTITVRDAQRRR